MWDHVGRGGGLFILERKFSCLISHGVLSCWQSVLLSAAGVLDEVVPYAGPRIPMHSSLARTVVGTFFPPEQARFFCGALWCEPPAVGQTLGPGPRGGPHTDPFVACQFGFNLRHIWKNKNWRQSVEKRSHRHRSIFATNAITIHSWMWVKSICRCGRGAWYCTEGGGCN